MNFTASMQEKLLFLNRFMNSPKQIGSVIPSSKFLCTKMIGAAPWNEIDSIAELGPGTGVMTEYIRQAIHSGTQVLLFEKEAQMRRQLRLKFPEFGCYSDACKLQEAMNHEGIAQLDCIISGLPFFNFTPSLREQLLEQISLSLRKDGWFIAFQYSLQMKSLLASEFEIEALHFVPFNVPPAFVYVCRKV